MDCREARAKITCGVVLSRMQRRRLRPAHLQVRVLQPHLRLSQARAAGAHRQPAARPPAAAGVVSLVPPDHGRTTGLVNRRRGGTAARMYSAPKHGALESTGGRGRTTQFWEVYFGSEPWRPGTNFLEDTKTINVF